jgi:hypothetical protein
MRLANYPPRRINEAWRCLEWPFSNYPFGAVKVGYGARRRAPARLPNAGYLIGKGTAAWARRE